MSAFNNYMEDNPNVERVFSPVVLVSNHVMGVGPKNDAGFTDNMQRIVVAHSNSAIAVEEQMHRLKHRVK
tara:strand:+ start:1576 stop:1785 length:210 start_codon:yes stop_codon:yes gene_type:complete